MAKENGEAAKVELTVEQVAKMVSGTVTVPATKGGKPLFVPDRDGKSTTVYQTQAVKVGAEHILGFRVVETRGGREVVATTVDGQKLRASLA